LNGAPMQALRIALEARAFDEGFADFGVCAPGDVAEAGARLRHWVEEGRQGDMAWMADRIDWRADPRELWPEARSVIMLAENYGPAEDPLMLLGLPERGSISVYARNRDYHDVVKKRLKRLGRWLIEEAALHGEQAEIKVFVDTAPVMEKPLAEAAGLGWRGKHTNLVSRRLGSWLFLGAIFTTLELPKTRAETDHCGGCRRCLDICPTAAFTAPYQLDAERCISYLTIELKGPIPEELRPLLGNRIYGCDDCQMVCPWNRFARHTAEPDFAPRYGLDTASLLRLFAWSEDEFLRRTEGSAIRRAGYAGWLRNIAVALGNSDPRDAASRGAVIEALRARLGDPSELVREHVEWALQRLSGAGSTI
jgi:epoxyqueuosine reductase